MKHFDQRCLSRQLLLVMGLRKYKECLDSRTCDGTLDGSLDGVFDGTFVGAFDRTFSETCDGDFD